MSKRHDNFYEFVALCLTEKMKEQTITTTQLASRIGEQYNTVKGVIQSRRFSAHHMTWINEFIKADVAQLFSDHEAAMGEESGQEESSLSLFI